MESFIDMSLEDIIQKRRKDIKGSKKKLQNQTGNLKPQNGKPTNKQKYQQKPLNQKSPVVDARMKIISKKRTQITDAREILAEHAKQKDARLKLNQLRKERNSMVQDKGRNLMMFNKNQRPFMRTILSKERVFTDPSRQVQSQPLARAKTFTRQLTTRKNRDRSFENRSIGAKTNKFSVNVSNWKSSKNTGRMPALKPIVRTVENDIETYDVDDPMDSEVEAPSVSLNRKASLQLKIITHNNELRETRSSVVHRSVPVERDLSPPRPPSILKKRPMAALRTEKKVEKPDKPSTSNTEYRIIVSSLGSTVTAGDIEELFGDVGGMIESRLVRPGTAEVIYKTLEDAQRAVDLYHKRQLDGQPMNCLLVTPRSNTPQRIANKPGLHSTNSNVEPDLSTFHKVLFSNF